jgi:hypothetical protein
MYRIEQIVLELAEHVLRGAAGFHINKPLNFAIGRVLAIEWNWLFLGNLKQVNRD